jgi:hypothetical protein
MCCLCIQLPEAKPMKKAKFSTASGRLVVTDKSSKRHFLIDTGSNICVFPWKVIPQRRTHVNYDLRIANGTTISTYGWLSLSFNLGLRQDFTWWFMVTNVTQPLIGADFLSHFGLLVDCRKSACWKASRRLHLPKLPALGSPASKSSVAIHQSTLSSPSFQTWLAPI